MDIEFFIADDVISDVFEIIDWYNLKRPGLGERFYNELVHEFENIKKGPRIIFIIEKILGGRF